MSYFMFENCDLRTMCVVASGLHLQGEHIDTKLSTQWWKSIVWPD